MPGYSLIMWFSNTALAVTWTHLPVDSWLVEVGVGFRTACTARRIKWPHTWLIWLTTKLHDNSGYVAMLIKIANYSANIVVVVLGYNIPRYAVDIVILESTTSFFYAY